MRTMPVMRVMRETALFCCCSLIACATANAPATSSSSPETIRVAGPSGMMTTELHPTKDAIGGVVPFTVDRAWTAVRVAYDSVSLPVATFDPATRTIASPNLRLRRRLGETALSKYINCGNVQGGQSADSYEIQLIVQTILQPGDAGTTRVLTTVNAEGRPITLAGEYTRCTSTGTLERRVVALVASELQR